MKRLFYSVFVTLLFSLSALAQNEGINFQGVARNAEGEVLVSQKINLRLSILLGSETGAVAYMETRQVTTNPQGVFALVVGDDKALTKSINFSTINWTPAPKFIKVEMDPNAGSNYLVMGTSRLQAVPFAFHAYGVDASNVKGVLPASKGGTGVTSMTDLKTSLGLDNFSNAALDTKVDKVAGKGLSSNNYTTAEKNKLEAITGTNTGDQDLSGYATTAQLATKANAAIVTTSLATKANISDVTTALAAKEDVSNKSNAALGTSRTLYPTQNAVKTYVDAQVSSATIADANASTKGKLQLAGDLAGTAAAPTVPSLLLKENVALKSTATDLGAGSTSDINYPSQKAVKSYVDAQILTATIADANATTKGKLQLAGDLTGDASAPIIASGAITSAKIQDRSIATVDVADLAITDAKISGISGSKVVGNIAGNAANVTGTVAVGNGGTGATGLTGYVKGNGSTAMTSLSSIPVADVTGAIRKVNGTLPNSSGEVTIFFGAVTTGTLAARPSNSGVNGDIYVVSGDGNAIDNGRTFISNGTQWNEVTANVASTDARYLQLAGGIMDGNLSIPTGKKVIIADAPSGSIDAANKGYVDAKIAADAPNATSSVPGKVQLTGDLGGTAIAPTVPGLALKAPIDNPAFTGTVTGITKTMVGLANVDNTTDVNKPLSTAAQTALDLKAPLASPTFTGTVSGITKSMVGLGNVDNTADADKPVSTAARSALDLKEDISNKSNAALGTSTTLFPTQNAVKTYVDAQIASGAPDANATTKGKLQLAGDLTGDASAPAIASGAVTSTKIADATIVNADIALAAAIEDTKLATIASAGKVSNSATTATSGNTNSAIVARDTNGNFSAGTITANLTGNATNVTGTVAVANGGTGATDLTGYVKGNGSTAMTSVSSIPVADVTGAIRKVNGTLPNSSGEVTITFGEVTTGTLANRPQISGDNGDIYVVSGDGNAIDNGRTFISNGTQWNEVTANVASTDARYLQLAGGIMDGNLSIPTGKKVMITDAPSGSTDAANKGYVDAKIASDAPNATSSIPGKVQLAGDLGGSAASPTVPGLALKAPIESPTFTGTVGGITKSMVGLGNVDNTADADKPVSTAAQTALALKAPLASPTFTGTVGGITKSMVGLGNVDNTADADKLVSTAAQTALDLKENASNKSDAALGTSTTLFPTQNAVKTYVDAQISNATIADADASTKGKVRLAGDLAGTGSSAAAPIISDNAITTIKISSDAVTSAKIADATIVNADIALAAAIEDTKLATIATAGKVSNSATTATSGNTNSAIVARDASGNFSAGTITASLTGNATNVTGTVAVANGGTGVTTAAANLVFAGPTSGVAAAPSFRGLAAADLPSGSTSYINNTSTQQTASFNINGSGTIGTDLTVSGLTASKPVFTDANKKLTSSGTLGVSQGGTGVTATPTIGQILIGNNTSGFTLATLSPGTGITITNSSGSISIAAAVRPTTDQFSATANQTSFTLTQTPLTNANSKDNVWMFINGVRTNNDAYSVSGTTVTYAPGSNGSYALLLGDRIQFDYAY